MASMDERGDGREPSWQSTPRWSPLRRDGSPRRGAAKRVGVPLEEPRRWKETTYRSWWERVDEPVCGPMRGTISSEAL